MLCKFSACYSHSKSTQENPWPTFHLDHETEDNLCVQCKQKHLVSKGKFANSCKKQFVSQLLWKKAGKANSAHLKCFSKGTKLKEKSCQAQGTKKMWTC